MNEKEKLLGELELKYSNPNSFYIKITIILLITIYLAIYFGEILFGKNSIDVLTNVRENREILKNEVKNIKKENAKLQKLYFETLSLKPQIDEYNLSK